LCISKRETVSYLQYVYVLDFVYEKVENCITHAVFLWSIHFESERGKLYQTYSMLMNYTFCSRKKETVSYLQYVYDLDCVKRKEGNCIEPTVCLWSRLCVSERGKLYHT
jgi:hypothetical protein